MSQCNVMTSCMTLYSISVCFIQITLEQLLSAVVSSASTLYRTTQFCFLLIQGMRLLLKETHPTEILFHKLRSTPFPLVLLDTFKSDRVIVLVWLPFFIPCFLTQFLEHLFCEGSVEPSIDRK